MFFSIIIPVFNAQDSLARCLDSIVAQTFSDFEAIIIDDGSKDQSLHICEKFAAADPRFTVIHQSNRGPSAARNAGISRAAGDFLCFVDSDDYISVDYLSQLHASITESGADILFFGYHQVSGTGERIRTSLPAEAYPGRMELVTDLADRDLFGYTWVKCISKALINGTLFPEDMFLFEDEVFTCSVLEKECLIAAVPLPLYYYSVEGEQMLTGRTHTDYCLLSDRVFVSWERLLKNYSDRDRVLEKKANAFVSRCIFYGLERDIRFPEYFQQLSETGFYQRHSSGSRADSFIQKKQWRLLAAYRYAYRMKQRLAGIFSF